MRHRVQPRRLARVVTAVAIAGMAATLGTVDAVAEPGGKDNSNEKGYLGVYMQDLTRDVRRGLDLEVRRGVLISGIVEDSPAEKAGIQDGDVIVKFDGSKVSDSEDLAELVRDAGAGAEVEVELIRDGDTKTVTLTLGERPEDFARTWDDFDFDDFEVHMDDFGHHMRDLGNAVALHLGPRLGIHTHELNEGLAGYFDTDTGVLVLEVEEESVAEAAGIKAGDVVKNVAGEDVENTRAIREAMRDLDEGDEFEVTVLRKGKTQTLSATMTEDAVHVIRRAPRVMRRHLDKPRVEIHRDTDKLREELDELREELRELKRELQDRRDG